MQILIFVITLLMLLGLLTYARIDSYVSFVLTRNQLEKYMSKAEREFLNLRNIKWYNDTPATTKEKDDEKKKRTGATSKLSLYPIIHKETKESDFDQYNQVRYVFKRLIEVLYGNSRFYKDSIAKRSNLTDEMLDAMEKAANSLPKEQKITSAKDLANLNLGDDELNDFFYHILKGTKREDSSKDALKKIPEKKDGADKEDTPVDDGYDSILDYINVDPRKKLRVFLAPKVLLLAITGNEDVLNEIIQVRTDLYQRLNADNIEPDPATAEFKSRFSTRISSIVNDLLLDYTVTKTDPRAYE